MPTAPTRLPVSLRRGPASPGVPVVEKDLLRVITINTHRGEGPKLPYLLQNADEEAGAHIRLLHETRAYSWHIGDWLRRHHDRYHAVALQEVFFGHFGGAFHALHRRTRQSEVYRTLGGYPSAIRHRVGFHAFRYENTLLSRLEAGEREPLHGTLPGRIFQLAACGFTLAPFRWGARTVWLGNTHLHAYNPRARAKQAVMVARAIRALGDAPVLFLGDLNTVPPGCKDGDFPHGDRDRFSYRDDRTLRILARAGLRMVRHEDREEFWTYPTGIPNRTLDYILFSRHWDVESYRVVRGFTLSDHYPVEGAFRLAR